MKKIYDIKDESVNKDSLLIAVFNFNYGDEFSLCEQMLTTVEEYLKFLFELQFVIEKVKEFEIVFGSNQEITFTHKSDFEANYFILVEKGDEAIVRKYFKKIANNRILEGLEELTTTFNE